MISENDEQLIKLMGIKERAYHVLTTKNRHGDFSIPVKDWTSDMASYYLQYVQGQITSKQNPRVPTLEQVNDEAVEMYYYCEKNYHLNGMYQMIKELKQLCTVLNKALYLSIVVKALKNSEYRVLKPTIANTTFKNDDCKIVTVRSSIGTFFILVSNVIKKNKERKRL